MSIDPQEHAAFQARLDRTSTQDIIQKLDDNVIARAWKRDLAEAEVARRSVAERANSLNADFSKARTHKSAIIKGWIFTILLIATAIVGAVGYLMNWTE